MSRVEHVVREAARSLTAGKKRGQGQGPSKTPAATLFPPSMQQFLQIPSTNNVLGGRLRLSTHGPLGYSCLGLSMSQMGRTETLCVYLQV